MSIFSGKGCVMDSMPVSTECICLLDEEERRRLTGVGGWLFIILIHLGVSFLYGFFCFLEVALSSESPETLKEGWAIAFYYGNGAINLFSAMIALLTLIFLLNRSFLFKNFYRVFIFSSFLYPVLFVSLRYWLIGSSANPWPLFAIYQFVYPLAMVYICLPYLDRSKRVRFTFFR